MKQAQIEEELKDLIVSRVDLEDLTRDDIETETPLFADGLGLDSIDALEIGMAVKKKYNVSFHSEQSENRPHFQSVRTLAAYIASRLPKE